MTVAQRWNALEQQLKELAPHRSIRVIAVAKHQSLATIQQAIDCGIQEFGDNYVQQGEALRSTLAAQGRNVRWHFIGHIQSRKVRDLTRYDCIQSMDRIELLEELAKRFKSSPRTLDDPSRIKILIQVNIGREPQKSGIVPEDLERFLDAAAKYEQIQVDGLMTMPPNLQPVGERARYFDDMRALFDKHAARGWTTLSMGTSEDYQVAIRCGATMIRLGTSLLGARPSAG